MSYVEGGGRRNTLVIAFVAGALIAAGIVIALVLLVFAGDDDGDGGGQAVTTVTPPSGTVTQLPDGDTTPPPPAETQVTGATTADDALARFVQGQFDSTLIGPCPQEIPPEGPPEGVCVQELHRTASLVTVLVGAPFSEFFGEVVLTANEDGTWSASFIPAPPLGEVEISVGSEVVVYAAGSCLNFRAEPSINAEVNSCQIDGTRGTVVDGPVEADGHTWWNVEGYGWASAEFLAPAQ
jgi:hypothetical protein